MVQTPKLFAQDCFNEFLEVLEAHSPMGFWLAQGSPINQVNFLALGVMAHQNLRTITSIVRILVK